MARYAVFFMAVVWALLGQWSATTADSPGTHGGTVAANDFGPNDLGQGSRTADTNPANGTPDYQDNNPNAGQRNYQTHGSSALNHDGIGGHDTNGNGKRDGVEAPFDRGDLASMGARYQGPTNGYEEVNAPAPCTGKIKVPKAGGANYSADFPRTAPQGPIDDKKVVENVKKFVHDLLQPACWPPGRGTVGDDQIYGAFNAGNLDIGKRNHPKGWANYVCHNQTSFFCALMRELGYPCREKWVSLTRDGKHVYPEAAANVWYGGKWHLEDPFLQVNDDVEDYKSKSVTDVRIWESHTAPWDRGPGSNPDAPTIPPDQIALRSGTLIEEGNAEVLVYARDSDELVTGDTTTENDNAIVDNFLSQVEGTVVDIPHSWYSPRGLPILSSWEEGASSLGTTDEHLFLGFETFDTPASEIGTRDYEACFHNQDVSSQMYDASLTSIETNRKIVVSPSSLSGTLAAGETACASFAVTVGGAVGGIAENPGVDASAQRSEESSSGVWIWAVAASGLLVLVVGTGTLYVWRRLSS